MGGLGQRNETDSLGLFYARQRYYDPQLGRWLSADPIGFAGGLNLYNYVRNSPTNLVDPEGLDGWDVARGFGNGLVAGALVAGAIAASGVEIPAAAAWGLATIGLGYTGTKLCTAKEPLTGEPIDVYQWDETLGGALSIPFVTPFAYKGPVGVNMDAYTAATARAIPRVSGGRLNVLIHGPEFDVAEAVNIINANNPGRLPIRILSCGASASAQRLASSLGVSAETTPADYVATLFPFPIPVALTFKPWYTVQP